MPKWPRPQGPWSQPPTMTAEHFAVRPAYPFGYGILPAAPNGELHPGLTPRAYVDEGQVSSKQQSCVGWLRLGGA